VRRAWAPYAVLVLVLAVALTVFGLRQAPIRAYALGVPNQAPIVSANRSGPPVCEGPIDLGQRAGAVRIWAVSPRRTSRLRVIVRRASPGGLPVGPILASGTTAVTALPDPYTAQLNHPIAANVPVSICVASLATPIKLFGAQPVRPAVIIHVGRRSVGAEFSLVLLSAARPSLFGALGTVAERASLFHWSWMGPWAVWLLALSLIGAVVAGGIAVAQALTADDRDELP
jgi:hypothetical protein